jgi:hypothetical protein
MPIDDRAGACTPEPGVMGMSAGPLGLGDSELMTRIRISASSHHDSPGYDLRGDQISQLRIYFPWPY